MSRVYVQSALADPVYNSTGRAMFAEGFSSHAAVEFTDLWPLAFDGHSKSATIGLWYWSTLPPSFDSDASLLKQLADLSPLSGDEATYIFATPSFIPGSNFASFQVSDIPAAADSPVVSGGGGPHLDFTHYPLFKIGLSAGQVINTAQGFVRDLESSLNFFTWPITDPPHTPAAEWLWDEDSGNPDLGVQKYTLTSGDVTFILSLLPSDFLTGGYVYSGVYDLTGVTFDGIGNPEQPPKFLFIKPGDLTAKGYWLEFLPANSKIVRFCYFASAGYDPVTDHFTDPLVPPPIWRLRIYAPTVFATVDAVEPTFDFTYTDQHGDPQPGFAGGGAFEPLYKGLVLDKTELTSERILDANNKIFVPKRRESEDKGFLRSGKLIV